VHRALTARAPRQVCFLCFDPKPPEGAVRNPKYAAMMQYQSNPNAYAVSLMDAPGKEPLACVATCLTVCCGLPACYYRKKALETVGRGVEDYVCCQGYFPGCCGCEPATQCQGQMAGLLLEGCCCPTLSLSFTRILLMDVLKLQPDPVDYQMIAFSNACQVLACICDVLSMFIEDLRDVRARVTSRRPVPRLLRHPTRAAHSCWCRP